ncbi:MAG: hypothetical protein U0K57_07550 [Lachnospiraceae bacterium]|nr:hypothetical protein [Lachnospiraceae bacterium]
MLATVVLVAIELIVLVVGLWFIVQSIEGKNWKKAIGVIVLLLAIMTVFYLGLTHLPL